MQTLSFKSGKPYACTKLGAIVYFNPRIQGWCNKSVDHNLDIRFQIKDKF
jgi:hypothetical protein